MTIKIILIAGFLVFTYALYEYQSIKITKFDTEILKNKREYLGKRPLKIVFVSDFQYDHSWRPTMTKMSKKVVKLINNENPDIVLLGGDYIHQRNKRNKQIFTVLKDISAPKFGVLGNHDYKDLGTVIEGLENAGVKLLVNEVVKYESIQICGLDDYKKGTISIPKLEDVFTICLSHNPDYVETTRSCLGDIVLSGHHHAGMITIFGKYGPAIRSEFGQKYRYGYCGTNENSCYVTSGVGGSVFIFPIRFFAKPEIVTIEL